MLEGGGQICDEVEEEDEFPRYLYYETHPKSLACDILNIHLLTKSLVGNGFSLAELTMLTFRACSPIQLLSLSLGTYNIHLVVNY